MKSKNYLFHAIVVLVLIFGVCVQIRFDMGQRQDNAFFIQQNNTFVSFLQKEFPAQVTDYNAVSSGAQK